MHSGKRLSKRIANAAPGTVFARRLYVQTPSPVDVIRPFSKCLPRHGVLGDDTEYVVLVSAHVNATPVGLCITF